MMPRRIHETYSLDGTRRATVYELPEGGHGADVQRWQRTPQGMRWVVTHWRMFPAGWLK